MPQKTKRIDVGKSFFVTDPNSVMENLEYTHREDEPETPPPIVAYEGYNFIPTSYGYRSYFGANSKLNIAALSQISHHCDKIILFQLANYANIAIALCDDGIWYTKSTTIAASVWVQARTLTPPTAPTMKEWSYCIIKNILYLYRQGEGVYYKLANIDYTPITGGVTLNFTDVTPTFLNMAGQIGIFRANASLGFWDSANSIAWSNPLDLHDFTPSLTTMAGNATFNGILGHIVTVRSQGDNFIIYTTKGIVGIRYIQSTTMIWEATSISDTAGISTSKEVTNSITEMEHYAYTNSGIKKIGSYNALSKMHQFEEIITEIYDFIREQDTAIYLDFLNGRYLFICLTNPRVISGMVNARLQDLSNLIIRILVNGVAWPGLIVPEDVLIVDDSGTTPMPDYIDAQKALDPEYKDDMYLVWRTTGRGTFPSLVTPLNDYVQSSTGAHIPNTSPPNHTGATVSGLPGDSNIISFSSYSSLLVPTRQDHFDDLGYKGYGSMAAGVAMLGVVDPTLAAYRDAQLLEWTNFDLITTANITLFTSRPLGSYTTEYIILDPTVVISDGSPAAIAAMYARRDAFVLSFIASNMDAVTELGQTYFVAFTAEYIDIPYKGTNPGIGVMSGVGTNYASYSYSLTSNSKKRLKKRSHYWIVPVVGTYTRIRSKGPIGDTWYYGEAWSGSGIVNPHGDAQAEWELYNNIYIAEADLASITRSDGEWILESSTTSTAYDYVKKHNTYHRLSPNAYLVADYYKYTVDVPTLQPDFGYAYSLHLGSPYASGEVVDDLYGHRIGATQRTDFYYQFETVSNYTETMTAQQSNVDWAESTTYPDIPGYDFSDPAADYSTSIVAGLPDPNAILGGDVLPPVDFGYTYPGATFLMQDGVPVPYYPTYAGALVLDTALKKWGKMLADFQTLIDFSPFNSASGDVVSYTNLGVNMGILVDDGFIYNMDAKPTDSYMRYGKIGYFRQGFTYLEEVRAHFRLPSTGTITLEGSLSGLPLDDVIAETFTYANVLNMNCFGHIAARWHTIKVSGNYDLQYLEYRGTLSSRR